MRSLNWKLSIALLLIVAISVGLMAFFTNRSTTSEFQQYISSGNMMYSRSLADNLGDLYSEQGTWDELQTTLENIPLSSTQRIIVADNDGLIIGDSSDTWLGEQASDHSLTGGTEITISDEKLGTLFILISETTTRGRMGGMGGPMSVSTVSAEEDFLDRVNDSLWKVALAAAGIALLIGLVLTRQITRPVKALISGVRHLSGGELSYRVNVTSRDEIGELADAFNVMAANLEKLEQSRQQLTADIAHELRTPLTIIEGTVNAIIDGVFKPDREYMDSIKEQTALLTHLINDLRDISLAESGQLKLNPVPTDIADLLKRVVSNYEPAAGEKNIRLTSDTKEDIDEIEVDPVRIEQVLSNLIGNAIRHTPSEGVITAGLEKNEDTVRISVTDTGEGMDAADLPHIFERFYRPGTSRSRKEGGTGLGLAIAKQMVEAHGGKITVESTKDKGSTFTVILPVK